MGREAPFASSNQVSPRAQGAMTPSNWRPLRNRQPHIFATDAFPVASMTMRAATSRMMPFDINRTPTILRPSIHTPMATDMYATSAPEAFRS